MSLGSFDVLSIAVVGRGAGDARRRVAGAFVGRAGLVVVWAMRGSLRDVECVHQSRKRRRRTGHP
jgi:hypothetical protein